MERGGAVRGGGCPVANREVKSTRKTSEKVQGFVVYKRRKGKNLDKY